MFIVGIEKLSYTNKVGRLVEGVKIHCNYEKKNCDGYCTLSEFVKPTVYSESGVVTGDEVEFLYNRYGSVERIQKIN